MGIYERLTAKREDSDQLKKCMEATVDALLQGKTDVEHPGMLLGDIQSGKTRAFTGVIALGFDKAYDLTVVFTKGTRALVKQTVQRFKSEFQEFEAEDILRIYDVMEMPEDLNEYIIDRQKLIIVVKKEDDNLARLKKIFFEVYESLSKRKVIIVDDEADFVSIGYRSKKNDNGGKDIDMNIISRQISDFRKSLVAGSDYLQVTATPYSLYLQPEQIEVKEETFAPMRPKFTIVLPRHEKYIGSEYYFEESQREDSPAQYLFQAINEEELKNLSKTHGNILGNVLNSSKIQNFREAIINYLVAGCIRILQAEKEGIHNYKSSFIVHTETGKV
ncbi:MAG: DEAD/DEAH box helicase family protein [Saprospiraceae bacterium]|nr:DEAD/DEAH box helicase family protein [Saprospiraceae bacterium]